MKDWVHKATLNFTITHEDEEDEVDDRGLWERMFDAKYTDTEPVEDIDYEEVNEQKLLD